MRRTTPAIVALLLVASANSIPGAAAGRAAQPPRPTFRSGIEVVRVTAVVQDPRGRPVVGLSQADFELLEGGTPRPIIEFGASPSPISLAVLVDTSGSMSITPKRALAREAVLHMLSWLTAGEDEAGLFAFDTSLRVVEPFTTSPSAIERRLRELDAYGQTSLFDAIAETSREVAGRRRMRGAVAVVTDGVDTSSRLASATVARLAAAIDVPVYVFAAAPPGEPSRHQAAGDASRDPTLSLDALAASTGGRLFVVSGPASTSLAARAMVSELRHQYLIGFEPNARAGWHSLLIRTRQKTLIVRTRSGYVAGAPGRP